MKEKFNTSSVSVFLLHFVVINLILTLVPVSLFAYASENDPKLFSEDSAPYGVSYSEWTQRWWQWYVSIPKTQSPNFVSNHIECSVGQDPNSPVFFLFSPLVDEENPNRTCTIPQGKAVLIPIVSGIADFGDPELPEKTDKALTETVIAGNNNAEILVKLDGVPLDISNEDRFRVLSDFFNIKLPENNLWEEKEKPGTYRARAEGYYVFLEPLSTGEHILYYEAGTHFPNPINYSQKVTYRLIVK
jgi:hypothetical protein